MMADSRVIRTLRTMAWQRAKGELQAVLETYWEEADCYSQLSDAIEKFVNDVEDHGMQE